MTRDATNRWGSVLGRAVSAAGWRDAPTPRRRPQVLSYGGGLDSFAMLVDAIQRGERPDLCVFVDVGNGNAFRDSTVPAEWEGTYRHIREVVIPLCARAGIEFVWIDSATYPVRTADSLFSWFWKTPRFPWWATRGSAPSWPKSSDSSAG